VRYLFPGDSRQLIAMGFNERGDVVGYEISGTQKRAFVYTKLIPPSTFTLLISLGINAGGQILCTDGQVGQQRAHGYLLTPR